MEAKHMNIDRDFPYIAVAYIQDGEVQPLIVNCEKMADSIRPRIGYEGCKTLAKALEKCKEMRTWAS